MAEQASRRRLFEAFALLAGGERSCAGERLLELFLSRGVATNTLSLFRLWAELRPCLEQQRLEKAQFFALIAALGLEGAALLRQLESPAVAELGERPPLDEARLDALCAFRLELEHVFTLYVTGNTGDTLELSWPEVARQNSVLEPAGLALFFEESGLDSARFPAPRTPCDLNAFVCLLCEHGPASEDAPALVHFLREELCLRDNAEVEAEVIPHAKTPFHRKLRRHIYDLRLETGPLPPDFLGHDFFPAAEPAALAAVRATEPAQSSAVERELSTLLPVCPTVPSPPAVPNVVVVGERPPKPKAKPQSSKRKQLSIKPLPSPPAPPSAPTLTPTADSYRLFYAETVAEERQMLLRNSEALTLLHYLGEDSNSRDALAEALTLAREGLERRSATQAFHALARAEAGLDARSPPSARLLLGYRKGLAHLLEEDFPRALACFRTGLTARGRERGWALLGLCAAFLALGRVEIAARCALGAAETLAAEPGLAALAHNNLSCCLAQLGRPGLALDYLRVGLALVESPDCLLFTLKENLQRISRQSAVPVALLADSYLFYHPRAGV